MKGETILRFWDEIEIRYLCNAQLVLRIYRTSIQSSNDFLQPEESEIDFS